MKNIKWGIALLGSVLILGASPFVYSNVEMVHVRDDFDKVLDDNDLVVAYVYSLPGTLRDEIVMPDGSKNHTPEWQEVIRKINIFTGISEDPVYDDQVVFVASNLDRGDMKGLRKDYTMIGDMMMVFRKGHVIAKRTVTNELMPADVKQFLDRANLRDFAEAALRSEEKKEEDRRARCQKCKRCNSCVSFSAGFGFGYPGWPYGWYGPSYYNSGPWTRWYW
ncbi:TPA: hypothetical protein DDZ86_03860 [Candidatus Dependentiae bacterium]|nr:MAG: hypothetical protein UW09_C0003G0127 [candidate division TM6 bacterium GW2011_GWF2_43_87]HBL98752.1 hypothetical protein [Candidatus Dependentiae bacterium]